MSSCLSGFFSDFTPRNSDEQELIPTGLRSGLASEAAPPKYLNQPITAAVSCPSRSFRLCLFRPWVSLQPVWRCWPGGVPSEPRLLAAPLPLAFLQLSPSLRFSPSLRASPE